jgi:hypothetical protein
MRPYRVLFFSLIAMLSLTPAARAASETVATVVYAKAGNGYKRVKLKDGRFKPEYYALSNGGLIEGTTLDSTVERVSYEDVVRITRPLLAEKDYRFALRKEQVSLLIVLNWGATLAPNGMIRDANIAASQVAKQTLQDRQTDVANIPALGPTFVGDDVGANTTAGFGPSVQTVRATNEVMAVANAAGAVEAGFVKSLSDDRVRDALNQRNAQVLGYLDELAKSNDIRRYAGGGNAYNDLITDVEESRYYIVISAYDYKDLTKYGKKRLLWQTRVSVRSPGNRFDESVAAMMRSASKYFGENSGRLVRGEETKGTVELGDLKFLGEAKDAPKAKPDEKK